MNNLIENIKELLKGIDQTENDPRSVYEYLMWHAYGAGG